MVFGRSERGKAPVEPVTLKILVAGGFGVGKTTLVGAVSEIKPLRTEELLTEAGRPVDDTSGVEGKHTTTVAMDFGRITLREDLVLYLFGTPGQDRFWFLWDELAQGALGAVVLADTRRLEDCFAAVDYFERRGIPFVVAVNCFDGAEPLPRRGRPRGARPRRRRCPVMLCDARSRESVQGRPGLRSSSTPWRPRRSSRPSHGHAERATPRTARAEARIGRSGAQARPRSAADGLRQSPSSCQPKLRSTALRQLWYSRSRTSASMWRRPLGVLLPVAASARPGRATPRSPSPAAYAAPRQVVSETTGRITGTPEHVRLVLHQQVVLGHAAVDLEGGDLHPGVLVHGVHDLPRLPARRLQHRARQVRLGDVAGQAR